jgi:diacylglycerol kinase family enzyme
LRVTLFHNEDAGAGRSVDEIRALIEGHGHRIVHVVDKETSAELVLERATDLVVAAGGDGTVAAAARVLAGQHIPLAILPLGTANNIAKSLCCEGPAEQLIRGWDHAQPRPLDLGIVSGDWGRDRFIESVGAGLIPAGIAAAKAERAGATAKPEDAIQSFRNVLSELPARRWTITIDGIVTIDDFLLVEVLNIPSIGPNIVLSQEADPSDGFLSVVIATEQHRQALDDYLAHREAGHDCPLALTPRQARRVEIQGWTDVHVDDQLLHSDASETVSIGIEPGALEFLSGPCLAP